MIKTIKRPLLEKVEVVAMVIPFPLLGKEEMMIMTMPSPLLERERIGGHGHTIPPFRKGGYVDNDHIKPSSGKRSRWWPWPYHCLF